MARNPDHAMQARPSHDERARQAFIGAYKLYVGRTLRRANRAFFDAEAAPAYAGRHGHAPRDMDEIATAMQGHPRWQLWSMLQRHGQELMWDAVSETLQREEGRLRETWVQLTGNARRRGSLELDPALAIPDAMRRTEIHLQPGGYTRDRGPHDFLAGALYEAGGALYSRAQGVGTGESKGEIILRFLAGRYPGFRPQRILDLACSAGASSTPYAEAFPDAEVHAIDVGPALLRYAHARAEALGVTVHFHQRDATATGFADASFDLVVSHNAIHEMPREAVDAMLAECHRLLRPGGICVHQDVPLRYAQLDEYTRFDYGWDERYNGEPFWSTYATADLEAMLVAAGFAPADVYVGFTDQSDQSFRWYVACGRK
jgi:2-polyprenyl-3-methyl-5-hydroxy-6-metoxy-1,4-benzoquinol methylase